MDKNRYELIVTRISMALLDFDETNPGLEDDIEFLNKSKIELDLSKSEECSDFSTEEISNVLSKLGSQYFIKLLGKPVLILNKPPFTTIMI